ncbi:homoserine dehydrogenase [Abyssibius alkaniclasticus]|uniref:homoserine dehydrogenase n=1 Tax=Abyssibius alkaniclasticus TaxID=2881234 RepID=UPI0023638C89|nr:homoserine dehydrogenase [Abyssibius alkaniclasticus]UPH71048.1 homoserine dehydrogenase [Abyssibius alkaniclasticus]
MTAPHSPAPLRIAIAGLGTVGAGIVKIVQKHGDMLAARAGRPIVITAISARSRSKNRGVKLDGYAWEDDPIALARRPDVDLVVEVMGGEDGPAKACVENSLKFGKHVVTANKALLAKHGNMLAALAEDCAVSLRYEAAIAGGIPIIKSLGEGLAGNDITRVMGVMNGTCNYILTVMEATGADYADVLAAAQAKGYAEADPETDVGGYDAAHKLAVLAALAFGTKVDYSGVTIEGIERISLPDIHNARDMGYRIKLLGVARMNADGLEQRMQPCLVPANSPLGQLEGVTNMVVVEGDFIGQIVASGPGAGEGPTASAIMGDIVDIARGLTMPTFGIPAGELAGAPRSASGSDAEYYLRFALLDAPMVLSRVTGILGTHGVSIDRCRQYDHDGDTAPLLIVTHTTPRAVLDAALAEISALEACLAAPVAIRIENV